MLFKVTIDTTAVTPQPSGVGFYITSLLTHLVRVASSEENPLQTAWDFSLEISYQPALKNWLKGNFSLPPSLQDYPHILIPLPIRLSNRFLDWAPNLFPALFESRFGHPQIIHSTAYTIFPYRHSRKVLTIFDVTFAKYPQYTDRVAAYYNIQVRKCLQWTDLILTISESAKRDIVEFLQVDPQKVWVTPLASRYSHLTPVPNPTPTTHPWLQNQIPYLLFVSTIEPRKNIITLIAAFNHLKTRDRLPHHLVLVGKKGWKYEPIFAAIAESPWRDTIHHLNYLNDADLPQFYRQADLFVYPSHYEGFGLPVLEAMTLGAPVVTSNTSSLPEVAGNAALLVDPGDPMQLADAILKVVSDRDLRSTLIVKGKHQAAQFSWQRTAELTLEAYRSLL
jgi:glycosyltransferase involved in cell wall biosynthesis